MITEKNIANPPCDIFSCKNNEKGECNFLIKNGESKHYVNGTRYTMLCAWYGCGRQEKCDSCKYDIMIDGGKREYCTLHEKLIPRGRLACEVYKHE